MLARVNQLMTRSARRVLQVLGIYVETGYVDPGYVEGE